MLDVNAKAIVLKSASRVFNWAVLAAAFGPPLVGMAQCTQQNNYDAWDGRALSTAWNNTKSNYYWEYKQVRGAIESSCDKLRCDNFFN